MKAKQDLSFWKLWNLSFGFFGVQIAYALQSANISRIFSTLGADPHSLSYFWILPPLMGIVVQPIVGAASDRTWCRFGRRIPYLFIGALVAVLVMCLLPNSGSFGMSIATAMIFGLIALMFLDTSINMAMQPFKMLIGDMVNEKQKGLAYSIQSFLCNAGSLVGYVFPFFLAWIGLKNTAAEGVIPDSVIFSFYIGAAILIACVIYTSVKVREMPPKEYAEYHGITEKENNEKVKVSKFILKNPSSIRTVVMIQLFSCLIYFLIWIFLHGKSMQYPHSYIQIITFYIIQIIVPIFWIKIISVAKKRKLTIVLSLMIGIVGWFLFNLNPIQNPIFSVFTFLLIGCIWTLPLIMSANVLTEVFKLLAKAPSVFWTVGLVQFFCWAAFMFMWTYTNGSIALNVFDTPTIESGLGKVILDVKSSQYQEAANWVGIVFAVQAIGSVLWAMVIPFIKNRKLAYILSLVLGGIGFISTYFIHDQWLLFASFLLIGCAWAAMLALPFTILTNALTGGHMGTYLGLFNGTICLPQIVAAATGGTILSLFTPQGAVAPEINMLVLAGVFLIIGACCVFIIKEKKPQNA